MYNSEDEIMNMEFHLLKYRLKQLDDYDKKVKAEEEKIKNEHRNKHK
jgi:hypothetical protein